MKKHPFARTARIQPCCVSAVDGAESCALGKESSCKSNQKAGVKVVTDASMLKSSLLFTATKKKGRLTGEESIVV